MGGYGEKRRGGPFYVFAVVFHYYVYEVVDCGYGL